MNEYEFWNELGTIFDAVRSYQQKTIEFNKRFISPWLQLGNVFGQRDSLAETVQGLRQATELEPGNAQNWASLGDALSKAESYSEAVNAYKTAINLNPAEGSTICNLAAALAAQARYAEAIPLYRQSINLLGQPKLRAMAWNGLGDAYRKINDYGNAVVAFHEADQLDAGNELIVENPGDPPSLPDQVTTKAPAQEEIPFVSGEFAATIANEPETGKTIPTETMATTSLPSTAESADFNADFTALETDTDSNHAHAASVAVELAIDTTAEISLNADGDSRALEIDATLIQVESEISDSEEIPEVAFNDHPALVDTTGAEVQSDLPPAIIAVTPVESQMTTPASLSPLKVEDIEADDHALRAAESQDVDSEKTKTIAGTESAYDEYLHDLIAPQILSGKTKVPAKPAVAQPVTGTLSNVEKQVDSNGKDAHIWNELGSVYLNSGRFDEAITACTKAIKLDSGFGWAFSNLALAHMYKGQNADAILYFQRSIELFSDDKDKAITWNRLGNLYRRQADYDNAIAAYQMADELDPESTPTSLRSRFSLLGSMPELKSAYIS